jgi:pyrroline-5-carboxylate reductase
MRYGFVGAGAITQAVVTGMIRCDVPFDSIALSPRNAEIAAALARLDARVRVCERNQQVLDASDVVCLAVVPTIADDVLGALRFEARHHVISFIATKSLDDIRKLVHGASTVARAVPLPAVAQGRGSTAICPSDEIARGLFSKLGAAVEVDDEHHMNALSAATATMASFYALLEAQAAWLVGQGLEYDAARAFLSGYHVGLAHDTTKDQRSFDSICAHSQTPGGINEQLLNELRERGTFSHYADALDGIMRRIEGR